MGTELSLCAALVPAALKLKFTLFVRKYTCSVACDAGNQCTCLAVFSFDGEVMWISFAHVQNTQYFPHLFKNKYSSNCHFPVFWAYRYFRYNFYTFCVVSMFQPSLFISSLLSLLKAAT